MRTLMSRGKVGQHCKFQHSVWCRVDAAHEIVRLLQINAATKCCCLSGDGGYGGAADAYGGDGGDGMDYADNPLFADPLFTPASTAPRAGMRGNSLFDATPGDFAGDAPYTSATAGGAAFTGGTAYGAPGLGFAATAHRSTGQRQRQSEFFDPDPSLFDSTAEPGGQNTDFGQQQAVVASGDAPEPPTATAGALFSSADGECPTHHCVFDGAFTVDIVARQGHSLLAHRMLSLPAAFAKRLTMRSPERHLRTSIRRLPAIQACSWALRATGRAPRRTSPLRTCWGR